MLKGFWFRGWWVGVVDFLVFTFPLHPIQNFDFTHWHISSSRYHQSLSHILQFEVNQCYGLLGHAWWLIYYQNENQSVRVHSWAHIKCVAAILFSHHFFLCAACLVISTTRERSCWAERLLPPSAILQVSEYNSGENVISHNFYPLGSLWSQCGV